MTLAGGAFIFGIFVVVFTLALIYSLYTRSGSAINQRPYDKRYSSAPGAKSPSTLSHDSSSAAYFTRGTR